MSFSLRFLGGSIPSEAGTCCLCRPRGSEAAHAPCLYRSAGVSLEVRFAWLLVSGTEEGEVQLGDSKW